MTENKQITAALDARFFTPLRRPRTRRVGVELELPVWNRMPGAATDFAAVHAATEDFLSRFSFPDTSFDDSGSIYRAREHVTRLERGEAIESIADDFGSLERDDNA